MTEPETAPRQRSGVVVVSTSTSEDPAVNAAVDDAMAHLQEFRQLPPSMGGGVIQPSAFTWEELDKFIRGLLVKAATGAIENARRR